nr:SpaA isopeptide-forming pilin-related protein [uncultured Tyzzerella sp.]
MQQKNIEKRIVAFILSFFMIFSNIINVFGYEWDLEIPPIINSNDDIVINGSDNITDDTVIINSNPNTDNNLGKNNNINNNTINTNIETTEKSDTNVKLLKESFNSETGLTVKVPILPTIQPKTLKNGDKTLTLVGGDKGADASVSFKGDESGATNHALIDYITRENNDPNAVAYCISPFYAGAKENGRTTVKVDSNLTATDRQLLGIAVAGYPHNKYNVAGYNDLTEEDKYYATLIAMEHLIFQKTGEYKNKKGVKFNGDHWNTTRWFPTKSNDANAQKIINVAKEIYAKGMDNHYDETKGIATINFKDNNKNDGTMKVNRDTYKLTITLNSDIEYSHALLQFDDPKIKQWATGDTKIQFYDGVDEKGTRLNWGTHQIDGQQYEGILIQKPSRKTDTITIVLDKATADSVITSNKYTVDYTAKFFGGGMQVGYKTRNTNSTLQDYVAITTGNATARNSISWIKNSTVESSTETTTATTTTRTEKGGLKILKYNAKTNELVPGAIFKIRGISQGVYDFNVQIQASNSAEIPLPNGGKAVCKDGVIEISNINVGTYEITEITPPPNFDLALGQNSQTVQVENQTNATLYPQVRFMNNPYGSLKIKKVDAITGQPLEGAVLKVSNPLFNYEQEFTTGADGTITINNLKQGSYEIKEVKAPNGYILSNETKVAILKWGEETTITYENQPKTSLQITKIDSETGAKLNGARFKLKHTTSGTEYFTDETVDGVATTTDLVTGTYILTEIQAPNGYILDKTERTIVIENNRVNEITIKNSKKPSLKVIKRDIETKAPLQGAKFEIYRAENNTVQGLIEKVGEYFTNQQGEINLDTLDYGWYCIKEVQAPNGYLLSEDNTKFVFLEPNQTGAKTVEVIFENHKKPNLTINKVGSVGKEPLQGAKFSLFYATTQGGAVTKVGDYVTDERGKIEIPTGTLKEGWYKLQETEAPQGYEIQGTGTYEFYLKAGESKEITVENVAKNAIVIKKVDADTGEPLAGANFSISIISDGNSSGTHGTTIANVITNHNGVAVVTGLKAGGYIIEETKAPTGYVMVEQAQTVWLNKDDTSTVTVTFENRKNAGLGIKKMDSITKDPLADAIFKVTDSKGQVVGTSNGLFRTDEKGFIHIPNLTPGAYVVQEIQAPDGYVLDNTPQTVHIEYGKLHTLEFFNTPKTSILIKKYDSETREPLANATFKVTDSKGQNVGNGNGLFTTNENGTILVPNLKKGTYIVEEVKAPNGYLLNSKPQVVEVDNGKVYTLEFFNPKYDSLTIVKLDSATKQPLANALIKVTTVDDKFIGEYRTDETGTIVVTGLKAGTYKVQEIQAPNGYVLDNTVKLVHLKQGEPQKVEIFNSKKAGIQILKRDSKTAKPLQGAKFEVRKVNGELIGANYITDSNGMITINGLEQGWYTVKETVAPNGYALNSNVQNVEVKSDKYTQIVFENDKLGSIRLKKIDYVTRKPIPNVKFKITKENGENVGEFVTDKWGEINLINKLEPTTYLIEEMAVPTGYALDKGVRKVKIEVGTETMVEWENYPLATLDLLKIDERTKKPISGVEFELLNAKKQSMGKFTTDKDGRIYLESKLAQGTYYIKETKAKDGYIKNDGEKMVELKWGKTTKVEFVNTPIFGQIEIHKIGSKNNQITGQLDGDNLKGAEFTIYEKATGKEVTRVVTNYNGIARTGELPYGEYIVKETKAPSYYVLNENEFEVSIKENGEVVKLEVENKSVDLKTGGEKSTVKETKAGDTIRYDFNNLQNLSTVALDDFYIHESLPSAITVQRIFTGTFNQNMKYRIVYKTNKNKEFKVLKDNLFTDRVYEIDLTKGLQQGEYITDLKYEFERVGIGFREVEKPFLYAKVNSNVKKNEQFTNILTVGGKYDMQTVKHEDKFTTTVISTTPTFNGKLPKTGY